MKACIVLGFYGQLMTWKGPVPKVRIEPPQATRNSRLKQRLQAKMGASTPTLL